MVLVAVPVKPFDAAKRRLAAVVPPPTRRELSRALAARTVAVAMEAGGVPLVLAADDEVVGWARELDVEVRLDPGSSLDEAAAGAALEAERRQGSLVICHADLPLLTAAELRPALEAVASGRAVISPSSDGGTSLLGGLPAGFPFAYGPASFHRHLARLAPHHPQVLGGLGLSLDLDEPADLAAAAIHPRGRWLAELAGVGGDRRAG